MLVKRFLKFPKALRRSLSQRKAQFNTARLLRLFKTQTSIILSGLKRIHTSQSISKDLRVLDQTYQLVNKTLALRTREVYNSVPKIQPVLPLTFDYRVVFYEVLAVKGLLSLYWKRAVNRLVPIILLMLLFSPLTVFAQSQSPHLNAGITVAEASPSMKAEVVTTEAPVFQKPVEGEISQKFSFYHPAIDITEPYGTPVKTMAEGKVEKAGWELGYGKTVVIAHEAGFKTRYAHLSEFKVQAGEIVNKGNIIGKVGLTGWTTGPHLHFEVFSNGKRINPLETLPN